MSIRDRLLIPEFAAVPLTEFSDSNFPDELTFYFSLIDMIARHSINEMCIRDRSPAARSPALLPSLWPH